MRATITTLLIFVCIVSFSQGNADPVQWQKIENKILANRNLEDISKELQQIKLSAIKRGDDVSTARSLFLLMHVADRKTEDTLFLLNSDFIDSTLAVTQSLPLSAIMHLLKAKRVMYFREKYAGSPKKRVFKTGTYADYLKMSESQLDSICVKHFDEALALADMFPRIDADEVIWLSYDPSLFLFKPDFRDIVFGEKVFFLRKHVSYGYDDPVRELLAFLPEQFMSLPDSMVSSDKKTQAVFHAFKEWANAGQPVLDARYYYIESLARGFVFDKNYDDSASEVKYEAYLERQLQSPYNAVKGSAVLNLTVSWKGKASRYYSGSSNWYFDAQRFDEKYRLYYAKTYRLIDEYLPALDSFPVIQRRLSSLKKDIEQSGIRVSAYKQQIPGEKILTLALHRNSRQLEVGIVKIGFTEKVPANVKFSLVNGNLVRDTVYSLPATDDFQWHAAYLKLDELPAGRYLVFCSDKELKNDTSAVYFELSVSNIAVLNNDNRVFVLDRTTGFPLMNPKIFVDGKGREINKSGYLIVKDPDADVNVIVGDDSISVALNNSDPEYPDEIFNKDNYDDLMEYYEENIKLRMFTDRGIYRPGQTVYYKGIFTSPDPKTGEQRVLNWKNLKVSFFKKLFYKLSLKFSKERIAISVYDAFHRNFKEIQVWPDEFGSFSGSFTLPKNAATGDWRFECDVFDQDPEHENFSVEEYKRPLFELTLGKPKKDLRLGDDFDITVKTRSFAGAKLDGTHIEYTVTAHSYFNAATGPERWKDTLLVGKGVTNSNGELLIAISDSVYLKKFPVDWGNASAIRYAIAVQAVDRTGESHEESTSLTLSARPVNIRIEVPKMVDRADFKPLPVSTRSEFTGQTGKQVIAKLRRSFPVPEDRDLLFSREVDTWLHTANELKTWFAEIKFYSEEKTNIDHAGEVIFKTTINTGSGEKLLLPYELLKPGAYSLELSCIQNDSLLGYVERVFSVFDSKQRQLPEGVSNLSFIPEKITDAGREMPLFTGNRDKAIFSILHLTYFEKGKKKVVVKNIYDTQ